MSKVDDACAVVRLLMNEIYAPNFGLLGVVAELFGAADEPRARSAVSGAFDFTSSNDVTIRARRRSR
jgi:hypothetical protein